MIEMQYKDFSLNALQVIEMQTKTSPCMLLKRNRRSEECLLDRYTSQELHDVTQ